MSQKNVLITGTSSGIGLEIAVLLASRGYRVVATMRNPEKRQRLDEAAGKAGVELDVRQLDVTDPESVERLRGEVEEAYGALDGLVNNAGIVLGGFFEQISPEEFRSILETNLFGVAAVTRAFLPGMREAGRGTIINISSVAGRVATQGLIAYCTSKWALEGFSEALYQEVLPYGMRVVLIEPGMFRTEIFEHNLNLCKGWDNPGSPYFERGKAMLERTRKRFEKTAGDARVVAESVLQALQLEDPPLRWPVGSDSRRAILLRKVLPERFFLPLVARDQEG